jgi:FAD/FMN-containing dehydrogenase
LNHIIDLDQENFTVTAAGGINFFALQNQLRDKGFFLPLDNYFSPQTSLTYQLSQALPSSYQGKYGSLRQYVTGLEVILPDGTVINLGGKCIKNVSGYDLMGLLIGSKERLGLISKATLRLLPVPEASQVICARFDSLTAAVTAASQLLLNGSIPAKIQVLNASLASAVNGLVFPAKPLLIAEFDGFKPAMPKEIQFFKKIISDYSNDITEITNPLEIAKLWLELGNTISQAAAKSPSKLLFTSQLTDLSGLSTELIQLAVLEKHPLGILIDLGNSSGLLLPLAEEQSPGWDWLSQAENVIHQTLNCRLFGMKTFHNAEINHIFQNLLVAFERRGNIDLSCPPAQ